MGHSAVDEREAAERAVPKDPKDKEIAKLKEDLWQSQHQHQFFIAERDAARAERDRLRNELDRLLIDVEWWSTPTGEAPARRVFKTWVKPGHITLLTYDGLYVTTATEEELEARGYVRLK